MEILTLHATKSKKKRITQTGTWYEFPCPFCRNRGFGHDPSAHLGVKSTGAYKCFRCGISSRNSDIRLHLIGGEDEGRHPQRRLRAGPEVKSVETRPSSSLPKDARHVSSLDPQSLWFEPVIQRAAEVWPAIPWGRLVQRQLAVVTGHVDRVIQPYISLGGEVGHVVRRFGGDPKALTFGPPGPATFPDEYPLDPCREIIVVEGWTDGAAVPFRYQPVFLLGSPTRDAVERLSEQVSPIVLCLDGDRAGRGELKSVGLSLLRCGRTFGVVVLGSGEDPADLGPNTLERRISSRQEVGTTQDFLRLLSSIRLDF